MKRARVPTNEEMLAVLPHVQGEPEPWVRGENIPHVGRANRNGDGTVINSNTHPMESYLNVTGLIKKSIIHS